MSTEPAPAPLMKFVLVMHDPTQNGATLNNVIAQFAAPRIMVTSDPDAFWLGWKRLSAHNNVFVLGGHGENIPKAVADLVTPWSMGDPGAVWVVYLPHSFMPRTVEMLQSFLQFVGVQPPDVRYVQSVRPAKKDDRQLIRFPLNGDAPFLVEPQEVGENTFELTDAFLAWRLNSAAAGIRTLSSNNAYWTHE